MVHGLSGVVYHERDAAVGRADGGNAHRAHFPARKNAAAVWPCTDNRGFSPRRNGADIVREDERVARMIGKAGEYLRIEVVGMAVARENAQALIAGYLRQIALGIVKKTDDILPFHKKCAVPDVCNAHSAPPRL